MYMSSICIYSLWSGLSNSVSKLLKHAQSGRRAFIYLRTNINVLIWTCPQGFETWLQNFQKKHLKGKIRDGCPSTTEQLVLYSSASEHSPAEQQSQSEQEDVSSAWRQQSVRRCSRRGGKPPPGLHVSMSALFKCRLALVCAPPVRLRGCSSSKASFLMLLSYLSRHRPSAGCVRKLLQTFLK